MKNLVKATLLAAAIFGAAQVQASTVPDTVKRTVKTSVKRTAHKVGHKTSELAAKGKAAIVDKKYEGKCGPNGETVYINEHSNYYYINKAGHKVFVKKSELMDKKM